MPFKLPREAEKKSSYKPGRRLEQPAPQHAATLVARSPPAPPPHPGWAVRDPHAALIAALRSELEACKLLLLAHNIPLADLPGVAPADPAGPSGACWHCPT